MDLALFDFDGTITIDPTYPAFVRFAVRPGRKFGGAIILAPLILAYRIGLLSDRWIRWAISRVAFWGDDPLRLRRVGADFAREVLPRVIRPEAVERIEWHKARGDRVVVVSAALDVYLQPWCEAVGIEVVCTRLEVNDGTVTGRYLFGDCCGAEKARRVRELCSVTIAIGAAVSLFWAPAMPSAERRARTEADTQLPPRLLDDACGRQIVLLGESPTHGFGVSMRLKAELVRTVLERCHVDAVFFESGIYDFLKIEADLFSGRPVSPATLMSAVGLLWNNADVAPLTSFLANRANQGHLVLGGLDDQIGRGTYAQRSMAADLVRPSTAMKKRSASRRSVHIRSGSTPPMRRIA